MDRHRKRTASSRELLVRWPAATLGVLLVAWTPLASAQVVGRTPGSADVSASGGASYTVPLWTPPGAGGLKPSLALVYSQGTDNGLLGVGWSVAGLSRISRCYKTIAQDGVDDAPTLATSDAYCLDGQRLRLESGTYGAGGSVYRTEIESFAKVTAVGTAGNGPASWEVRTKDGLILEYGNSTDSRIESIGSTTPRVWAISSMRDRANGTSAGNTATFVYIEDTTNGSYRPDAINYAGNANQSLAAPYQVKFVYEVATRSDPIYGYFAGSPSVDGKINEFYRMDQIEIRHQGAAVKIYDLAYEAGGGAGGRARLASVKECSTSLSECLSPTTFTWTTSTSGLQAEVDTGITAPANLRYADVNGDGLDDMVYTASATWRWRLATGSGFGAEINTTIADTNAASARIIEWDGDGRWDLLVPSSGSVWQVYRSNGSSYDAAFNTGISSAAANSWYAAYDVNGDGRDDLIRLEDDAAFGLKIWSRVRGASNFAATETSIWTFPNGGLDANFYVQNEVGPVGGPTYRNRMSSRRVDLDGDGKEDFYVATRLIDAGSSNKTDLWRAVLSSGTGLNSGFSRTIPIAQNPLWQSPVVGDFNGDGLTDVAWSSAVSGSTWRIHMSSSRGLAPSITGPTTDNTYAINSALVLDYDHDGRDDVLVQRVAAAPFTWWVFRGTGTGLAAGVDTGIAWGSSSPGVAEVNGDGNADLVYGATTFKYRLAYPTPSDFLASATDGFGVAASFTYAPLTDSTVYTKGTGASYPVVDIRPPSQVVKTLTQTDGSATGTTFNVSYTYAGGRADFNGRGFLGFETRTIVDGSAGHNLRTIETARQDFPYIGALSAVELQQSGGTRIRRTTNTWASLTYGSGTTERRFPYVSSSSTDEHELGGVQNGVKFRTVATSVATIDTTSGLVTDATATTTEVATGLNAASSKTQRVWHTGVFNDTTNWCLGRPSATSQIASHTLTGGASITRTSDATWDGINCRPTQQRVEPGNASWQVTVGLGYDGFGNVNSQTVTGIGMSSRTTTLGYGTRGQFPETISRQVDATFYETSSQTWNYGLGVPATATDPNSLVVSWQYDNFGRRTLEIRPDSTRTAWSRTACTTCGSRVTYYLQADEQNTSAVTFRSARVYVDRFEQPSFKYTQLPGGGWTYSEDTVRDARGRPGTVHEPYVGSAYNGYRTFTYDALNRVTNASLYTSAGAFDRQSTSAYEGLSVVTTDPRSNATRRYISAWGDLMRIADAAGGNTNHQFDAFGNLLQVTDAYSNVSASATYNVRGMRTQLADMNLGTWTFTPNALGEVVSQLDAKSQTATFAFDRLGRLTSRTEAEGTSTWTWGQSSAAKNVGRIAAVAGPGYSESLTYNSVGQLVTRSITSDATYAIDYAYNNLGALHTLTYPTSTAGVRFKVKYGYSTGYQASVRDFTGDVDGTVLWSLTTVDPRGNPIDESYGNGLRVITGFNPMTGLMDYRTSGTGGSTTNVQNLSYTWDKAGNLSQRQDVRQSQTEAFVYDSLNRFDYSTLNGSTNLDVTLDLIGNVTYKSDVGSYTYHATKKHAVTAAGSSSFAYDANGNVSTRNGSTITWASYNLPTSITGSGQTAQFWYAPDRGRWKQVSSYAGGTETTIYVGGVLEKMTASASGVTRWRHLIATPGANIIHVRRSDSTTETNYLTKDHIGSTDAILNASGVVQSYFSYAAYGARRGSAWSGPPSAGEMTAAANFSRRGFTEHEMLDNIGLVHLNGRVYDPLVGRFMGADPVADGVGASSGFNRYAYVRNNPLSFTDPSGTFTERNSRKPARVGGGDSDDLSALEVGLARGMLAWSGEASVSNGITGVNAAWCSLCSTGSNVSVRLPPGINESNRTAAILNGYKIVDGVAQINVRPGVGANQSTTGATCLEGDVCKIATRRPDFVRTGIATNGGFPGVFARTNFGNIANIVFGLALVQLNPDLAGRLTPEVEVDDGGRMDWVLSDAWLLDGASFFELKPGETYQWTNQYTKAKDQVGRYGNFGFSPGRWSQLGLKHDYFFATGSISAYKLTLYGTFTFRYDQRSNSSGLVFWEFKGTYSFDRIPGRDVGGNWAVGPR
jgi:RHS repeat-associated protein